MFLVRTLILIGCLAVMALAQGRTSDNNYVQMDLWEVAKLTNELEGHRVAIIAEIVSVSADFRTMNIFDNGSKTTVAVSLTRLSKSQRQTLVNEPVHRVSVFGRVGIKNGRTVIKADQVMPLVANLVASN